MSHDVDCPYCGAELEINHDDGYGYTEDEQFQQTCGACEKTFVFTTMIVLHHEARKADCLNGAAHAYEKTKTYPPQYARMRCTQCGDERPLPDNTEAKPTREAGSA